MTSINKEENNAKEKAESTKRRKSSTNTGSSHMKQLMKMKYQERIIERELINSISQMKIESHLLRDIEENFHGITCTRHAALENLFKAVDNVRSELKIVKRVSRYPEEMDELDISAYKTKLLKISQKLQDLKKLCAIESLKEELNILESDLNAFELNLRRNNNLKNSATQNSNNIKKEKQKRGEDSEADDFHEFVARTGHTENWSNEDHLLFMNLRKKCNGNISNLIAAVQQKCPDLSVETIASHEMWYKTYLSLREKQKSAILKWRLQKEEEKSVKQYNKENTKQDEVSLPDEGNIDSNSSSETSRVRKKKKKKVLEQGTRSNEADSSKVKVKELIEKWKLEKENQRAAEEEQLQILRESKRLFEESRKQRRMRKLRNALHEYQKRKALKTEVETSTNPKGNMIFNSALIKAFREQDQEYTKRKRDQILRVKKSRKIDPKRKVKRVDSIQSSSTLFNPTAIWTAKCRPANSMTGLTADVNYIKNIPKLSTKWRNEESVDFRRNIISA